MEKDLSIVILAAGQGTRMKSKKAKVLHEISSKPMLYFSIKEAKKITCDITVILHHQAKEIQACMQNYFTDIKYHIQDCDNYPGTGGALKNLELKGKNILVLNADMPLIQAKELQKFTALLGKDTKLILSLLNLKDANGYGRVVLDTCKKVKKIVEQKDANKEELKIKTANAGVYLFAKDFLEKYLDKLNNNNAQKEYYITDLVHKALRAKLEVKSFFVNEKNFKGVNNKYDLAGAEQIHQNRIKKEFMLQGVLMRLPDSIFISEGVKIEGESIIENGVSLLGNSKIISSHIKASSIIEDSLIKNSSVGPFARVRPKSEIINSQLGNFVETKKSKLEGVKAGHLSYLGDCEIKEGTNVGAGFISCNYDGKTKHKTKIGKNVFIGSDVQVVAPINIADNVLIAAGSTITKDLKKGELGISRAKQRNIKDFFYDFFSKKTEK